MLFFFLNRLGWEEGFVASPWFNGGYVFIEIVHGPDYIPVSLERPSPEFPLRTSHHLVAGDVTHISLVEKLSFVVDFSMDCGKGFACNPKDWFSQ